ncbi:phosphoglycolate phosphatase [Ornithinibacillus bavariensis]|uniref:Phosphoglycolate phosphatase n=2 Tax=Ornithinibacillus bavariensis TaxID=545502 RepID=A0A919XBG6_9BACI|nr:phosphoglycolate phosphatase [Ornithinibacillus bavariensis]
MSYADLLHNKVVNSMNILWDFDGTLFDTYPMYASIFSQVLGDNTDEIEIIKHLKVSFSHAINHYKLSKQQVLGMHDLEKDLSLNEIIPFDGIEEVLKFANKNVIMSHKDRDGVLAILQHHNWEKYFTDLVTIYDGFPRKPNPAAYNYLHRKHRIDLVIGDREIDILPAKELEIATCLFRNKYDKADYYLENYSDFFEIIAR